MYEPNEKVQVKIEGVLEALFPDDDGWGVDLAEEIRRELRQRVVEAVRRDVEAAMEPYRERLREQVRPQLDRIFQTASDQLEAQDDEALVRKIIMGV